MRKQRDFSKHSKTPATTTTKTPFKSMKYNEIAQPFAYYKHAMQTNRIFKADDRLQSDLMESF